MNLLFNNTVGLPVHRPIHIAYRTVINSFGRDVEVVSIGLPRFCNTFLIDQSNDWHFRDIFSIS